MNRHLITALTAIRDAAEFCLPGPSTEELLAELRGMPKSWDRPIPTEWLTDAHEAGYQAGVARERAAVVAYMRDVEGTAAGFGSEGQAVLSSTADAIERGEHVAKP